MEVEVYEGRDGWLFLAGYVAACYIPDGPELPDAKLDAWAKLIEDRATRLDRMGIEYVHMPAPEKLTIYDNYLLHPIVDWKASPALRVWEKLSVSPRADIWLDVIRPLRAERDKRALFPKTDSHWNAEALS